MSQGDTSLFLIFLVLSLIYTCIFIYTVFRTYVSRKFLAIWKYAKLLYILQLIVVFIRLISFWYITIFPSRDKESSSYIIFVLLSLPGELLIVAYIILFWVFITANIHTRIRADEALWKNKCSLYLVGRITMYGLCFWIFIEFLLYGIILLEKLYPADMVIQQSICCYIAIAIVLAGIIYLQVKYSGLPYNSLRSQKSLRKIIAVTIIWTLGRFSHATLYIMRPGDLIEESNEIKEVSVDDVVPSVILLIDLISEILCYVMILESSFFNIFTRKSDSEHTSLMTPFDNMQSVDTVPEESEGVFTSANASHTRLTNDDLRIEMAISEIPNKLGSLHFGTLRGANVAVRKLNLTQVSKYVLETIDAEISSLRYFKNKHYNGIIGSLVDDKSLKIISAYMSNFSLYELLHDQKRHFPIHQKLVFASELAFCIKEFHNKGRIHGHLSSHNVLFNENFNTFISDLGFDVLKKYAGLVAGYVNKSAWSSPEVLSDTGSVVTKAQKSDDAYSFGIILWELLTEEEPFPGVTLPNLKKIVVGDTCRPVIPQGLDHHLRMLMQSCWNVDPSKRPDFELIYSTISSVLNQDE
ncbi:unnamed protein product [Blepharisma stoltei]|uniref:Protein kinase domain-containing protein n=1 Tax=Blepharisma stoltei TaxID=1481888 RepID=A0AAU9KDL7_9CILI|nr:unnamed protein product [Blepharisma stoltei]